MAIETAEDLAAFFDVGAWGVSATYAPASGGSSSVTVILDKPVERLEIGALGVSAARRTILVRASEVATPRRGDAVTVGGETLRVGAATLDLSGKVWELEAAQ